jgi:hypothetical protein
VSAHHFSLSFGLASNPKIRMAKISPTFGLKKVAQASDVEDDSVVGAIRCRLRQTPAMNDHRPPPQPKLSPEGMDYTPNRLIVANSKFDYGNSERRVLDRGLLSSETCGARVAAGTTAPG